MRIGNFYDPTIWNHRFQNCRKNYFKHKLTEDLPEKYLISDAIRKLQEYDEENDSEYINTLRVYLDNNLNALKTSELLYIHRATMNYRLKRIREIADIDFSNPEEILFLQLCLHILLG